MLRVFLCFASPDRHIAHTVAERLRTTTEIDVIPEGIEDNTLGTAWEGGTGSAGIILLLSPESVSPVGRKHWSDLLHHVETHAEPPVRCVLVRPCRFPRLLERAGFLNWDDSSKTLRELQSWAVGLHGFESSGFRPAAQPR